MSTVIFDGIPETWEDFVKNITNPSFFYSREYLNLLIKSGYSLKIIAVIEDDNIVCALPIVVFEKFGFKTIFYLPLVGYDSIIHLPNVNKTKQILDEFVKFTRVKNVIFSKLCDMSSLLEKHKNFLIFNGFEYEKEGVYVLEIKPLDDMWNNVFDKKLRNSIRKSETFLKIEEIKNIKQAGELYPLFVETSRRHDEKPHPLSRYIEILNLPKNMVKWYAAKFNGKYIATSIFWFYKNEIIYSDNASLYKYRKYAGSDLIMWEMIKFAIKNNYKKMNMSGVPKNNINLRKYKEKWGSKLVECDVYIYKSPLYKIFFKIIKKFIRVV